MAMTRIVTAQFEDDVRHTAEAVWNLPPGGCYALHYKNSAPLHELDGIVRLPTETHLLMITTGTTIKKVRSDIAKLNKAEQKEGGPSHLSVRKWLITRDRLETEHLTLATNHNVTAVTHAQFRRLFFDAKDYLTKRPDAAFGSARDLRKNSITIPDNEYVPLPMRLQSVESLPTSAHRQRSKDIDINAIANLIDRGSTVILQGPFGAGKSLTAREVFRELSSRYTSQKPNARAPLAINCREHWEQDQPYEILNRHAANIGLGTGYAPTNTLTVAWRAGMVHLLLDGFDELATRTISSPTNKNYMRQARRQALRGIRELVTNTPADTGILLCGRDHYFDDIQDMAFGLGLTNRDFHVVQLGEFNEGQVTDFLGRRGITEPLPAWLPRKPLILGYLAHKKLLQEVLTIDGARGFGHAWDSFLTLICKREAEYGAMSDQDIRHVLEALACMVRGSSTGPRPITGPDLSDVYQSQIGGVADEHVLAQLQRLPGLTPRDQDTEARSFVDSDMLAALQGSAVAKAIQSSSPEVADRQWFVGLVKDGVRMAAHMLRGSGFTASTVLAITRQFASGERRASPVKQLVADCTAVALELASDDTHIDCQHLVVRDAHLDTVDFEDLAVNALEIRECFVDTLHVGRAMSSSSALLFNGCIIGRVVGVPSPDALPGEVFKDCEVDTCDDASTNAAVLKLKIPKGQKVLLTILRKLYLQAGGGRRVSALKRGLPSDMQVLVDKVIDVLRGAEIISVNGEVAHPLRRHTARVHELLRVGGLSDDVLVTEVNRLSAR